MPKYKFDEKGAANQTIMSLASLSFTSEIGKVPKLDILTCNPDWFEIWKQRWTSAITITGFSGLPRENQLALIMNILSDDTMKRMNSLGLQDVNAIIESFQTLVCGKTSICVYEFEFHNRVQSPNESFEEFYTDLQSLLKKCQYRDCLKREGACHVDNEVS